MLSRKRIASPQIWRKNSAFLHYGNVMVQEIRFLTPILQIIKHLYDASYS